MNQHSTTPLLTAGPPPGSRYPALILVHGRGATAESIMQLAGPLGAAEGDISILAPQAATNTWYPLSFLAPTAQNEPWLSWALDRLAGLLADVEAAGVRPERVAIAGFSQGACLSLEFAARNARRFGALLGFSGGLIGPPGTARAYSGSLGGTPVLLGCSDVDAHVPLARIDETAAVLAGMGANVDKRIYAGMGHLVNEDEIAAGRALVAELLRPN
ncbi:MAG: alpha/beta hydrolase [Gemmatimonadota bacterium]